MKKPRKKPVSVSPAAKTERVSFKVALELAEKMRDCVYWSPGLTMTSLFEEAVFDKIKKLEKDRGEPFPSRESELSRGRKTK